MTTPASYITAAQASLAQALALLNTPTGTGETLPVPLALQGLKLTQVLNVDFTQGMPESFAEIAWGDNSPSNVAIDPTLGLVLKWDGKVGCRVSNDPLFGASAGVLLPQGSIVEWGGVLMPSPTLWGTLWLTADGSAWPAGGEEDYLEGGENATAYTTNYHGPAGASNNIVIWPAFTPALRTITGRRSSGASGYQVYDGITQRGLWTGDDNGDAQAITMSIGTPGAPAGQMSVKTVRAWTLV